MSDAVLVQRALDGDKDAFGTLVERYRNQVYGLAFHYVRDFEIARDLAQESFVQAYLKLRELRDPEKFAAWLRTLAMNACRMWLRRREVRTVDLDDDNASSLIDHSRGAAEAVERAELDERVRRAIDALPERQRLAVTMFYIDGLSYQDIAEFTGESVNAVESRLHRARGRLKERMMHVVSETLRSHQLPEKFTNEVLKKVHVIRLEGGPLGTPSSGRGPADRGPALFLRDEQEREFPVRLTFAEAIAIQMQLEGREAPRPMTHDLFKRMIDTLDIRLEKVVLTGVQRGECTARMFLRRKDQSRALDARGGDALALALRAGTDVYATVDTLRKARRLKPPSRPRSALSAEPTRDVAFLHKVISAKELKDNLRKTDEDTRRVMQRRQRRWPVVRWEKEHRVVVREVVPDAFNQNIVVLADERGWSLCIYIGPGEAMSIARGLPKENVKIRPRGPARSWSAEHAHDLVRAVLVLFSVQILCVAVDAHGDPSSVFYGVISMRMGKNIRHVDARPSDAIALAGRFGCPMYMDRKVMKKLGVPPERIHPTVHVIPAIVNAALHAAAEQQASGSRIIFDEDRERSHAVLKGKGGNVAWEQTGQSFELCRTFLRDVAGIDPKSRFPQKGRARCAIPGGIGGRVYDLSVTVREKPMRMEVRLKPLRPDAR